MNNLPLSIADLIDALIDDARSGTFTLPKFHRRTDLCEIWYELAFCISSSQERTRRALAAAASLGASYSRLLSSKNALATIASIFEENFISLRFINRKTEHLAASFSALHDYEEKIINITVHFDEAARARDFLVEKFPGIGSKQASMLLRNIGWGEDLAIIDSHISKMSKFLIPQIYSSGTPSYGELEAGLRSFAASRSVNLQTLDVILWSCSRLIGQNRIEETLLV